MEQKIGEPVQQEQPQTPLRCPRCGSLDTKFRYFNNNSRAQPRHYCRTCKRQWTVGGNLKNIPIGGKKRSGNQTKNSSSRGGNPRSQTSQPPVPTGEGHLQNLQSPAPLAPMFSQNLHMTSIGPFTSLLAAVSPFGSYIFNNQICSPHAIQSLNQPEINTQHVNVGYHFGSGGADMSVCQQWNIQSMASQEALPQEIPRHVKSYQIHNQPPNAASSHFYSNNVAQPPWLMNSLPHNMMNNFCFTTLGASSRNNFSTDTTDTEDNTSVNVDQWLNFPDHDSP